MKSRNRKRIDLEHHSIPTKANRILHFILIALLLIIIRVWHLSVIQYDRRLEDSQKPQRKVVIEPAVRATIRDRFNLPLAINKISYQATILYSQLRTIPSIAWQKTANGQREKIFKRREYIHQLSTLLAKELNLDAERVEDLIHAKASYYSQMPFVIKDNLSEEEYYRLKAMERDWPALHVRELPTRYYPKGRVAGDIIGYMGAINRTEYEKILHEIRALEQYIRARENDIEVENPMGIEDTRQARRRLSELQAKAYSLDDYIGKTGIEGVYEEQLRGYYGKKIFYADSKGNFLRELPGSRPALAGNRVLLTISSELQEYAEQLLTQNEAVRMVRKSHRGPIKKTVIADKEPWIKGGGIVAIDPQTGDILALASYPRFDPNDFILSGNSEENKGKKKRIHKWFENQTYLGQLWDQQQTLSRERYDLKKHTFYDEEFVLSWKTYLNFILPKEGKLKQSIEKIKTISQAIEIQKQIDILRSLFSDFDLYTIFNYLYFNDSHEPYGPPLKGEDKQKIQAKMLLHQPAIQTIKKQLDPYFKDCPLNYDKVLIADLCRLAVDPSRFSPALLEKLGKESLEKYHELKGYFISLEKNLKEIAKKAFHENEFKRWRLENEKDFLKIKRSEEKQNKTYPKPYIDYLDSHESLLFQKFWQDNQWEMIAIFIHGKRLEGLLSNYQGVFEKVQKEWMEKKKFDPLFQGLKPLTIDLAIECLKSMRAYEQLTRPLLGRYRLKNGKNLIEKDLATAFYPVYGYGYGRSHAYRQSTIQGSLFKLVTAYAALTQRYKKLDKQAITPQDLNPLVIIDEIFDHGNTKYVGYTEEGKPIPQIYKGGRLPRSLALKHRQKVDLLKAIEYSSNPYFSLLAGECLESPEDLTQAALLFGYGSKTGLDLPGEAAGKVPRDLLTNRTGLYAMAIGQHSLVVNPLQTALMLCSIANGGKILKPNIVKLTAGRQHSLGEDQIVCLPHFPFQNQLSHIGIDFPLFSALSAKEKDFVKFTPAIVKREIFMPEMIRQLLLKGLKAVTERTHQENINALARLYKDYPEAIKTFAESKEYLYGKTSTSESVERIDLDLKDGTNIYTHVWFGSIAFEEKDKKNGRANFLLKDPFGKPEVVVVVYLRYGGYGKEAAPIAAQIAKKWREIKQKYEQSSF